MVKKGCDVLPRRINRSRIILIISVSLHVIVTFPLVSFVLLDGVIQQQIYMHFAAHFGKHEIAFIGDSITAGGHVWADKIGVYNLNMWNYAQGGFKTDQVASYANRVARKRFKFCFIMSGRNDELTSSESIQNSYNDYIAILSTLRNHNVEPIVTLVLYRENEPYKKYIDEFNSRLSSFCILNNITIIDLNVHLCNESGLKKDYSKDGVHLTKAAYRIWGREINKVLHEKKYLE